MIDIIKVSIERQQKETSQLYKNIDISIDHAITAAIEGITDLKEKKQKSTLKGRAMKIKTPAVLSLQQIFPQCWTQ